jgi:hypothetical protein
MPGGEVSLQSPPEVPRVIPGNLLAKLMPIIMLVAVVGMIALVVTVGGRNVTRNPMFLLFPMMMIMSIAGMFMGGGRSGKAAERSLVMIAMALTVPPSICGFAVEIISHRKSMRPPCRSCIAGPVPL